jgi:pSer/pThr/pTyr-binding forkhead associated (FHA) protein
MTPDENDSTRVRAPKKSAAAKIPPRYSASLVILQGHAEGMEYPLTKTYTVLGRDKTADILLQDPLISRQHAAIVFEHGVFSLKDLESTNGTMCNGQPIQTVRLKNRDKFSLGDTEVQFIVEDTSAAGKVFEIR